MEKLLFFVSLPLTRGLAITKGQAARKSVYKNVGGKMKDLPGSGGKQKLVILRRKENSLDKSEIKHAGNVHFHVIRCQPRNVRR